MNLFLAHGNENWPSSRIRAWDVANNWEDATCYLYQDAKHLDLDDYENIVLQKIFDPEALALSKSHNVYLDVCDPDWWDRGIKKNIEECLPHIKGVVTSSEGLAVDFMRTFGGLATWIDDRLVPEIKVREHQKIEYPTLVWFGMAGNRAPCLHPIGLTLNRLLNDGIKFRLLIIDNEPETKYIDVPWCFHQAWKRDTIHATLCNCDVALLPTLPGPWGQMKSENKYATAWWAGLPVSDGLDYFELKDLLTNPYLRVKISAAGRMRAELRHNVKTSVEQWKELIASEIPAEVA